MMGDMHTQAYFPRLVQPQVEALCDVFPVVVVTGARQTGKSTLVQRPELFPNHLYLTLDDVLVRDQARRDPELLLDRGELLVIDEVQHAPDLLLAIKRRVDEKRIRGQYVLTGSSNLLVQRNVSESMAGRAGYVPLLPLTRREQLGQGQAGLWTQLIEAPPSDWPSVLEAREAPMEAWEALAARGGSRPPLMGWSGSERVHWFAGYAATYLERDLRQLSAVENLADMRRLMTALCLRLGGLMNQAELSRDLGLPSSTVRGFSTFLRSPSSSCAYRLLGQPHSPPHQGPEDLLERHGTRHAPRSRDIPQGRPPGEPPFDRTHGLGRYRPYPAQRTPLADGRRCGGRFRY